LFAYPEGVSSTCRVSFTDGANITHTVTVSASSLYEAAALGIAEFKKSGLAFANIGPATRLTIAVEPPATTHELSVGKLQTWLDTNGKTPREQAAKVTVTCPFRCTRRSEGNCTLIFQVSCWLELTSR
jgi:hypothetical protein